MALPRSFPRVVAPLAAVLLIGMCAGVSAANEPEAAWASTQPNLEGFLVDSAGDLHGYGWDSQGVLIAAKLSALDGSVLWTFPVVGRYTPGLAAEEGGGLVVSGFDSATNVFTAKLAADGSVRWTSPYEGSLPMIDANGNVYVSGLDADWQPRTSKLAANNGQAVWSVPAQGQTLVLDGGGDPILGNTLEGTTTKLSASDGTPLWSSPVRGEHLVCEADQLYVGGVDAAWNVGVFKLSTEDGSVLWAAPFHGIGSLAMQGTNSVYVAAFTAQGDWFVHRLDPANGQTLWAVPFRASAELAVDASGDVYASGPDETTWQYRTVRLSREDGTILWTLPVGGDRSLTVDGSGAVSVWSYPGRAHHFVPAGIHATDPSSAVGGSAGFTLTVDGFGFTPDVIVTWNGAPRPTTYLSSTRLLAEIPSGDLASQLDIATAVVQVRLANGTVTAPRGFTILGPQVEASESAAAGPGLTATVSTAPATEGASGVTAEVTNAGSTDPLSVTVANYTSNPTPGTVFDVGGSFLDVQVGGADAADTAWVSFYYSATVSGPAEADLQLLYFNGSGWTPVLGDGGTAPEKNTADNLDATVSGGRFRVLLSATSIPGIEELTGTVFVVADGSAPAISNISGAIEPIALGTEAWLTVSHVGGATEARVEWGDGNVDSQPVPASATFDAVHAYAQAGVYSVVITLTDAELRSVQTRFDYIVVYDPEGGHATGGGWIESPLGAYAPDPSVAGRAAFGFTSKYRHGATTPDGSTEFRLTTAQFSFRSTSYEWLVVAGARAQFKGVGRINGEGEYAFLLTAIDGQRQGGGGTDRFRIKIWNAEQGLLVYDNHRDLPDDTAGPNLQPVLQGSIVIHK